MQRHTDAESDSMSSEDESQDRDGEINERPAKQPRTVRYASEIPLKPKHITLLRYGDLTREIGPPAHYSALTCETKNGLISRDLKRGRSFRNPIQSLKCHVELNETWSPEVPPNVTGEKTSPAFKVELLQPIILDAIQPLKDTHEIVSSAQYCGSLYKEEGFIAYFGEDDYRCRDLRMGKIILLMTCDSSEIVFVVDRHTYEEHEVVNGWKVEAEGRVDVVRENQLASHQQYTCVHLQEDGCIITKAAMPIRF